MTWILELYEPHSIPDLDEPGCFTILNIIDIEKKNTNRTLAINGDRYPGGKKYKNKLNLLLQYILINIKGLYSISSIIIFTT